MGDQIRAYMHACICTQNSATLWQCRECERCRLAKVSSAEKRVAVLRVCAVLLCILAALPAEYCDSCSVVGSRQPGKFEYKHLGSLHLPSSVHWIVS